jgi:3-deoxy-manno-octulosonate cytidylyltransferase (CMP-KDO synthetase)
MKVACVIPARYDSSRFPGKLLASAQGKTVLQRTFESARRCKDLDSLFVATDDRRIKEHIESLGGNVILTSSKPKDGTERICEAMELNPTLKKAELILNLQGDHPLTEPDTLSAIIRALQVDSEAVLSTAAVPIESEEEYLSPHIVKVVFDKQHRALYFSRAPIPYGTKGIGAFKHLGIYGFRTSFLKEFMRLERAPLREFEDLEQLKVLEWGHKVTIAEVKEKSLGVDTPQDLVKLEEFLCLQNTYS